MFDEAHERDMRDVGEKRNKAARRDKSFGGNVWCEVAYAAQNTVM